MCLCVLVKFIALITFSRSVMINFLMYSKVAKKKQWVQHCNLKKSTPIKTKIGCKELAMKYS